MYLNRGSMSESPGEIFKNPAGQATLQANHIIKPRVGAGVRNLATMRITMLDPTFPEGGACSFMCRTLQDPAQCLT